MGIENELSSLKKEGETLIKQATLLIIVSTDVIKRNKSAQLANLDKIKETVDILKVYQTELKKMFSESAMLLLTSEDEFTKLTIIGDKFTKWIYGFTSEVICQLEEIKDATLTLENDPKSEIN